MKGKPCTVPGCAAHCRLGHLMCPDHWSKVPASVRALVNKTWREYRACDRSDREQHRAAVRAYAAAAQTAVASITAASI